MKIVHVNTNYSGGAAIAMQRIHNALLEQGIDSKLLYLKIPPNPNAFENSVQSGMSSLEFKIRDISNRVRQQWVSNFNRYAPVSSPYSYFDICGHPEIQASDIVHLHWVSKMIDYPSFFAKIKKPVIWTIHDMAPFSGGNHYTIGYDFSKLGRILDNYIKVKGKSLHSFKNLTIVSPSQWLLNHSLNSPTFGSFRHFVVRNPIIIPNRIENLKAKYGYNSNDKIILFLADNVDDKRKGINYFLDALNFMNITEAKILLVGGGHIDLPNSDTVKNLGHISDKDKLVELFQLADVYVTTALEDNFPNTIIEAMSGGTPVVGFDYSGVSEMIQHKSTGYLAEYMSAEDIANGIEWVLSHADYSKLSDSAIQFVSDECNPLKIANQYIELYQKALN